MWVDGRKSKGINIPILQSREPRNTVEIWRNNNDYLLTRRSEKEGRVGKQAASSNFIARSQKILFMLTIQQIAISILFGVLKKTTEGLNPKKAKKSLFQGNKTGRG